ncbi:MAG: cache domain-containing protein [Candidatus Cloacimonetes bacterium]|nr:cache domain-containing protein [Candidatus Cloacimonadota bacterium]
MPRFSLRTKLILSFSVVIIVGVFLSTFIGIRLIDNTIIKQAQNKVRLDLNSAREVYQEESENIKDIIRLTAIRFFIKDAILKNDINKLKKELQKIRENESLDILTLTDKDGRVIVRANNPVIYDDQPNDEIVNWVLQKKQDVVATQILPQEELEKEGKKLTEQARIELIPTPRARQRLEAVETSGMMVKSAAPVLDYDGNLIGVLCGGKLLNQNYEIVDKVKEIVYKAEKYKQQDVGTATIFQGDLRISTNVHRCDGTRAIGTRVSEEVFNQVVGKGIPWIGRAFVVTDWYITAYEPIRDINGEIIGMLYVGMLEAPYIDLRNRVVFTFLAIAFLSIILLSIIAYFSTTNVTNPIKKLLLATKKVAKGDLSHRVQIKSQDEIGQLAGSFNSMTAELQKATEGYLALSKTLEEKVKEKTKELEHAQDQLIQSEKLSSLGKLSAGIAHEINNPLTSILLNSHLISEKLEKDSSFSDNMKLIIDETARCSGIVKGLLEFSRQSPPEKRPADINKLIEETLLLFESQILVHNVRIDKNLNKNLPRIMIDTNKIEQVFTNIILNALESMQAGGILSISSQFSEDNKFVEIKFQDTGCGIPKENINKIFDPFFTTKGAKGTGLGLSVSYGIVQQHNGKIDVRSKTGKGTTFTICFPARLDTPV